MDEIAAAAKHYTNLSDALDKHCERMALIGRFDQDYRRYSSRCQTKGSVSFEIAFTHDEIVKKIEQQEIMLRSRVEKAGIKLQSLLRNGETL